MCREDGQERNKTRDCTLLFEEGFIGPNNAVLSVELGMRGKQAACLTIEHV